MRTAGSVSQSVLAAGRVCSRDGDECFASVDSDELPLDSAAATPYGIYYQKQDGSEATGYLMDHTASVIVVDPDGHLRLIYPFGTPGEDIAEDISHLVR